MKKYWFFSCFVVAQFLHAYTPPIDAILSEIKKSSGWDRTQFSGSICINGETKIASFFLSEGRFFYKENNTKNTQEINLYFLQAWLGLKKSQSMADVNSYFGEKKIDPSTIHHALFDYEPVFIIGAKPLEPDSPQIWIEKKHFLPVKEINKDLLITYEKWTIDAKGTNHFPRLIKIHRPGSKIEIALVEN